MDRCEQLMSVPTTLGESVPRYRCCRPAGHEGPHHAHSVDDVRVAVEEPSRWAQTSRSQLARIFGIREEDVPEQPPVTPIIIALRRFLHEHDLAKRNEIRRELAEARSMDPALCTPPPVCCMCELCVYAREALGITVI